MERKTRSRLERTRKGKGQLIQAHRVENEESDKASFFTTVQEIPSISRYHELGY